jgi:3-hydroxyacyl-CoA dehydrogenase
VGLDTFAHVARNVYDNIKDEKEKKEFAVPELITRMVEMGLLGEKVKQGFYKKVKTKEGSEIYSLDYNTMDYVPLRKFELPVLNDLKRMEGLTEKLKTLVYCEDRAGKFAWKVIRDVLLYSAGKIPEIADDVIKVDEAMKWGYNWELGPFATWDAIGVKDSVRRMEKEGKQIPENVREMLLSGKERFYEKRGKRPCYFDFKKSEYKEIKQKPEIILLPSLKEKKKLIKSNSEASLVDLGDGVACLEFHSPRNSIGAELIEMMSYSIGEVEENFEGLLIGNHGRNFCVGANLMLLLMAAQDQQWEQIRVMVQKLQGALMQIKCSEKPVVAAPSGMALGGGCEICMAASKVRAYAESYIGLVEVGVGLIPAAGGCKELLLRNIEWAPSVVPSTSAGGSPPDLIPYVARAFETIAMAKVATSAKDAQKLGYLRQQDKFTMNQDYFLHDAKETVLAMAKEGYRPYRPKDDIRVMGRTGRAILELSVYTMKEGGYITDYDAHIAKKLAYVLTGGDLDQNTLVSEKYLLELEMEVFVSLCGEKRSQDRMRHMLQTNKPLRN